MNVHLSQKYIPKRLYKPVRIDDIRDLLFEESFNRHHKNVIKDYIYCGKKILIS